MNRNRFKLLSREDGSCVSIGNLNEQIIGLEMVCQINNELEIGEMDASESRARTRTTTLTADNVSIDYQVF